MVEFVGGMLIGFIFGAAYMWQEYDYKITELQDKIIELKGRLNKLHGGK